MFTFCLPELSLLGVERERQHATKEHGLPAEFDWVYVSAVLIFADGLPNRHMSGTSERQRVLSASGLSQLDEVVTLSPAVIAQEFEIHALLESNEMLVASVAARKYRRLFLGFGTTLSASDSVTG